MSLSAQSTNASNSQHGGPKDSRLSLIERIAQHYLESYPEEAAQGLDRAGSEEVAGILSRLTPEASAQALRRMNDDAAAKALCAMPQQAAAEVLLRVDSVRAAKWLHLFSDDERQATMAELPESTQAQIAEALSFPPGSAGSLMDPAAIVFREETTIEAATRRIRQMQRRVTDILICDDEERLAGIVRLQELLGAPLDAKLGQVATRRVTSVHAMASRDEVVELLSRYHLASLPVVDLDGKVLGIIRYDGLVLAAQQAATDDLQQMVGASKEERALSTPWFTVKSRLPWLLINLVTAFVAAFVVGLFDSTIAKFTALAVLLPVVAGQSGNTGAQALAVTSRGLALREIRSSHWWRVVKKEITAAGGNGLAVALVTAAAVLVSMQNLALCLVIGASMVISMVLAAMSGALIPILLVKLGRDPATASSIILTTVTDITGFLSFLGLATLFVDLLG